MAAEFIIVVEVDHLRAQSAYRKGMDELNLIWPQLMVYAESVDGPRNERVRKGREDYEEQMNRYFQRMDEHNKRVNEWERGGMFRGPRPSMDIDMMFDRPRLPYSFDRIDMKRSSYESVRKELKRKADIANAAVSPYRMTESQVHEMVAWEDGSRIERLKNEIGNFNGADYETE
jgi:hypothetical protein